MWAGEIGGFDLYLSVHTFSSLFFLSLNFSIFQVGTILIAVMSSPVAFQCSFNKNENKSQICLWLPMTAGFYLSRVAQSLCADHKKYKEICDLWFVRAAATRAAVIADGRVKGGRLIYDFCV